MEKHRNRKEWTLFLYLFVCCKHFSQKISIINLHHIFLVSSHVFKWSVGFHANFLRSFLFISSKILGKLSLLFFGGNIAMWAKKVSVVLNLLGSLTRLFSKFSRLLLNLGNGGKSLPVGCSRLEFLALLLRS